MWWEVGLECVCGGIWGYEGVCGGRLGRCVWWRVRLEMCMCVVGGGMCDGAKGGRGRGTRED